jgi:ABC-type uncharacterized transport system substrate-binding protein
MSYGPNPHAVGRKMAGSLDRILNGAQPGDLPVAQLSRCELLTALRIAREAGLDVPRRGSDALASAPPRPRTASLPSAGRGPAH